MESIAFFVIHQDQIDNDADLTQAPLEHGVIIEVVLR